MQNPEQLQLHLHGLLIIKDYGYSDELRLTSNPNHQTNDLAFPRQPPARSDIRLGSRTPAITNPIASASRDARSPNLSAINRVNINPAVLSRPCLRSSPPQLKAKQETEV